MILTTEMGKQKAIASKADDAIINKIYLVRGEKVMLDSDLAELFEVETKQLKRQVNRNLDRFPESFMFELNKQEADDLRSQIGTSSWGGSRYLPYVFTEYGVLQLSNVLRSERATQMSIRIIEVFVRMRQLLLAHKDIAIKLEKMERSLSENTSDIQTLFQYLKELLAEKPEPRVKIGFKQPTKTAKKKK